MAINYQWYNSEKTVILLVFEKKWTWDEYSHIQKSLFSMIDSVEGTVHYLIDVYQVRSLPLGALNKLPVILSETHPRRGKTLIVGASAGVRHFWQLLQRVIPQARDPRYLFLADIDEADKL